MKLSTDGCAAGRALAAAALLGFGVACAPPPPNVLLIVVDTLRADHLGCYGHARDTSPAIDALAASGTRFERAYSTAPWTMPSVASILTGLYPTGHGASSVQIPLPLAVTTLAEVLHARGFAANGVVSHNLVSGRTLNFDQGFDTYSEEEARGHGHVSTPGVTEEAITHLREHAKRGERFFLFVHYFDPHWDYRDHEGIDFAPRGRGRLTGRESYTQLYRMAPHLRPEEFAFIRDLYDEEIRFTDEGIGRLLSELARLGLDDETIVALTADHGEEFGERRSIGHTRTLYDEVVHVPLIIRAPDGPPAQVVATPVSLVSVTSTLLELAGVDAPELRSDGASLAAVVLGRGDLEEQTLFSEVDFLPPFGNARPSHKKSLMRGSLKLIWDDKSGTLELYDRAIDPGERVNLAPGKPVLARQLLADIEAHLARAGRSEVETGRREIPDDEREMLEALGYAE